MANDVFKMLKDLELRAVGLDEKTKKMQEGYLVSFRSIGLPIHKDDYANPYSPLGVNLEANIPVPPPADPKDAPRTGSENIDTTQKFAANIAKSQQAYLNTYALVNNKLQMNSEYSVMPGSSKLADTWYAIISGANGIPPTSELNAAMTEAYAKATAKLMDKDGNVTPHYQAYMQYEDDYKSKVRSRNKAYAAAFADPMKLQFWPQEGVLYQEDVDQAWSRWMGLGFKEEIEKALNSLAAQGTDPAIALIARAKKKFQNSLLHFENYGDIPYTLLSPRTWYDKDNDEGWNVYSSKDFSSQSQYSASQTSFGGGGGVNVGLWSASAGFEHSDARAAGSRQVQNLDISFSYAVVDIDRPWLDTSLLNLNNWFLVGDYKAGCISTGRMGQLRPTNGTEPTFLPSIVTSLIIVKDVKISWKWRAHTSSNSAKASVGFACFSAQSHYSHAQQNREFSFDDSGEKLEIPGVQLLGYVSQILPNSPQRNSSDFQKKARA